MRTVYLFVLVSVLAGAFLPNRVAAQCTSCPTVPANDPGVGLYLSPIDTLWVGFTESQTLEFFSPNDTVASGIAAKLRFITVNSVTGLKAGVTYNATATIGAGVGTSQYWDCDNNLNGTQGPCGCVRICGNPATEKALPTDSATVNVTIGVQVFGFLNQTQAESFKVYIPVEFPFVMNAPTATSICNGSSIPASFVARRNFNAGNTFTIELVNTVSGVATTLGTASGTTAGTYGGTYPFPGGLAGGTYRLRVRSSAPVVTSELHPTVITIYNDVTLSTTKVNTSCGANNGSITATGGGGTSPYQYRLNAGAFQASGNFTSLAAGTYKVTVRDANNCLDSVNVTINPSTAPSVTATVVQNVSCNGGNNGSVSATGSGGTTPYQYSLNGGAYQSGNVFSSLTAGTYTVTLRDAAMCTVNSSSVTVTQPAAITGSTAVTTTIACNGASTGVITTTASGGTGVLQYSRDGGTTYQASNVFSGLPAGTYTVRVRDANNCIFNTASVTLTNPPALTISANGSNPTSCASANGSVTANATGGTGAKQYSLNGGPFQSGSSFTGLGPGTYVVTVRDANNCTLNSSNVTLSAPSAPSATAAKTNITCNGANNGSVTTSVTGGLAPYTYVLNPGGTTNSSGTFTGLGPNTYTVQVTDANSCVVTTNSVVLTNPPALTVTATKTDVSCNGGTNGSIAAVGSGGTGALQYSINGTTFQASGNFTGLGPGTYTVTVRDANLCTATSSALTLTQPSALTLNTVVTNVSCAGASNGQIVASAAGGTAPYTFSTDGSTFLPLSTFSGLAPNVYFVYVRDANACQTQEVDTLTEPAPLVLTANGTNVSCTGLNNGSIAGTATGGTAPYTYTLNPGGTSNTTGSFPNLAPASYDLSVVDANGCTDDSLGIVIVDPAPLSFLAVGDTVPCFGDATGTITVTASGGTGSLQYSLDGVNFQSANSFTLLGAGNYTVTVRDANGCSTNGPVAVSEPGQLTVSVGGVANLLDTIGTVFATVNGGTAPFSYDWNLAPGVNNDSLFNQQDGLWAVTVTDANGCTATDSTLLDFSLSQRPTATASLPLNVQLYPNPNQGTLNVVFDQALTQAVDLRVLNLTGQVLLHQRLNVGDRQLVLDLKAISSGVYVLQLASQGQSLQRRFVRD